MPIEELRKEDLQECIVPPNPNQHLPFNDDRTAFKTIEDVVNSIYTTRDYKPGNWMDAVIIIFAAGFMVFLVGIAIVSIFMVL